MPSEKTDTKQKETAGKPAAPHKKGRLTWILSVAFLVLVVVVFVFSPVVSAFVPKTDSLVFGTYDGEPIEYAYGNYFYQQQQNIASNWDQEATDENYQYQIYQIWKQAFDNTVVHTAVMQQANRSGIIVTDEAVDRYLLERGPYIGENGKFSSELYNNTSAQQRSEIRDQSKETLLYSTVVNDMFTSFTSDLELEFISSMASETSKFDYVTFPSSLYPEERVISYAQANLMLFTEADLSIITLGNEDEQADSIQERISNGEISFEDAAREYSIGAEAETGGAIGPIPFVDVASILGEEDAAHAVFSLAVNEVSEVYESQYGKLIFKLNESPTPPDFTDADVIADVRSYMENNDSDLIINYVTALAEEFRTTAANSGFSTAAQQSELEIKQTEPTPLNYGNSSFMNAFAYTDPARVLSQAATDEQALDELYSLAENDISQPLVIDQQVLVARCVSTDENPEGADQVQMLYPYIVQQVRQEEYTDVIFNSDKLESNFMQVFLSNILQNG
jgi:parvulin-like peptidyl-prolyl isomerase